MRSSVLILIAVAGIVFAAVPAPEISGNAQASGQTVRLVGAVFSPPELTPSGISILKVSVAAETAVPETGADGGTPIKALIQVVERSNFSGIDYSVSPSRLVELPLAGGGRNSTATFTFAIERANKTTGNIACRIELVGLKNNQPEITADDLTKKDVTLPVTAPGAKPTPPSPRGGKCTSIGTQLISSCTDFNWDTCKCDGLIIKSPVIVDIDGDAIALTDREHGVNFDMDGDGIAERVSWTAPDSDDAFLFLDRNEDAKVNNCTELFGNMTPQPYAPDPNGFVALAMYDTPLWGGNGDGVIDSNDAVYFKLRLWQDKNHNGISEPEELHTLPELGVTSISLDYKESKSTDQYGNRFRYRAKVERAQQTKIAHWAWDVFLR